MARSPGPAITIPPTAFVALGGAIARAAIELGPLAKNLDSSDDFTGYLRWALTARGLEVVILVALLAAAIDVMRSSTGVAALGGRIAAIGFTVQLALHVVLPFLSNIEQLRPSESFIEALPYVRFLAIAAGLVGLALAARMFRDGLVAGAVVLAVLADPPGPLGTWIYGTLGFEFDHQNVLYNMLGLVGQLAAFLLFIAVRMPPLTTDAPRALFGMRLASASMWLRIVAATSVTTFTLLLVGTHATEGAGLIKFATALAMVTNVASLAMLGVALFALARSALHEMPRVPMAIAGALALWVCGVASMQLPLVIEELYFKQYSFVTSMQQVIESLSIIGPITVIVAVAIALGALVSYGARRGLNDLTTQATKACAGFIALAAANLGIQHWLLPTAKSTSEGALYCAMAIVSGFAGLVLVAKTFGMAALDVANEPSPPPRAVAR